MKVLLRNFLVLFRRFRLAMTLNVLGLSVAFTTFMVILMQWRYDTTFDEATPNSERVFRVDWNYADQGQQGNLNRALAEVIMQSSSHIEVGALINNGKGYVYFLQDDGKGERHAYKEEVSMVMPSFTKVFPFKMLEGSADILNERNQLLIPQSLARKLFGNESAIGKRLDTDFKRFVENGIYLEFNL